MNTIKSAVERQFSSVAENYRTSTVHAGGDDLVEMVKAANLKGGEQVLDAGSGAGHTTLAFAPHVAQVTSVDLSVAMLAQGQRLADERGISNAIFRQGDVERLPYADQAFDVIVSRYSAHHWPHPQHALHEFRRLLRQDGRCLLADIVSYPDFVRDTHLQAIELLRDPSHVRDHRPEDWLAMMEEAGFHAEVIFNWSLRLHFDDWVARMATPAHNVEMIRRLVAGAPSEVREALQVEADYSFVIPGALFRAHL